MAAFSGTKILKLILLRNRLLSKSRVPALEHARNGVTFKSRNPREPHFDRKRMLEICKPVYLPAYKPAWETCTNVGNLPQELGPHPYEKLLADDLKKDWLSSRLILFYHTNPMSMEEKKQIRNMFFKKGLNFCVYSHEVVKLVLQNTPYEAALHLFCSPTALVMCPEGNVSQALKLSKKASYISLLAGIIDGVFLSRKELQEYSKLPVKDVMYQQLTISLNSVSSQISRSITNQTDLLSRYLNEHSEGKSNSVAE